MAVLTVDPTALRTLGATCQGWSGELATASAPLSAGTAAQATTAAVATVNAAAGLAAAALAVRMQSTATKLVSGSADSSTNEELSAARVTNVTAGLDL